jgi:hypothetical protein
LHAGFHYRRAREDADTDTEVDGQEAVNAPATQDGSATAEFADESDSDSQVVADPSSLDTDQSRIYQEIMEDFLNAEIPPIPDPVQFHDTKLRF